MANYARALRTAERKVAVIKKYQDKAFNTPLQIGESNQTRLRWQELVVEALDEWIEIRDRLKSFV